MDFATVVFLAGMMTTVAYVLYILATDVCAIVSDGLGILASHSLFFRAQRSFIKDVFYLDHSDRIVQKIM